MRELVRSMGEQIRLAVAEGPLVVPPPEAVVVAGMGGSSAAAALLLSAFERTSVPVVLWKDYGAPSFTGAGTLFLAVSYSGNTEETLSAFGEAERRHAALVAVTSGGALSEEAKTSGVPVLTVPGGLPPRCAVGHLMGAVARVMVGAGVLPESGLEELTAAAGFLDTVFERTEENAEDVAERLFRRLPVVYAPGNLFSIAERWRAQLNENAKSFCHTAPLPELCHNEYSGLVNPEGTLKSVWVVYLSANGNERNAKRVEIIRRELEGLVIGDSAVEALGDDRAKRVLHLVLLGDLVSLKLAAFYGVDPFAIPRIDAMKSLLAGRGGEA